MKLNAPRTKRTARRKTVKLRTNGKHPVKGASVNALIGMNRLLRPQARYNWLMPNIGAITPQYIEMVLRGALAGAHVPQYELFDLMLSTWPELSACCQELTYGVMRKKLVYEPFHDEDEKPTPNAIDRCALVSTALRGMEPDPDNDGNDLAGTLKNILDGWIRGVSVSEIVWESTDTMNVGTIAAPRTTFWVQPTQYGFAWDNRIGLRPRSERAGQTQPPFSTTSSQPVIVDPFPPNKFLVAIHKAKTGSPLGGPLLIPLAWWWCAANFSSDWLLNLAQVFGLPFRWANYDTQAPQATIDAICNMLQNMGSAGWAAFPVGTTLEMISQNAKGSDHSPQGELLDRADRYARNLILGQTMTGSHGTTGKGGGQAFGKVESEVKSDRIDAAGRFAESVINKQLIPFILALNYGDTEEAPKIKFLEDEVADLAEAQRDTALSKLMPIGLDYLRKKYDVPEPAEGEETTADNPATQNPMDQFGGFENFGAADPNSETNTGQSAPESDATKASDITLRSPNELRPSVVDNHIVRGYMARIESGEQLDPIVLRESGRIKDGNHRAAAYKKLGLQVPTVIEASSQQGHPFRGNQYVTVHTGDTVFYKGQPHTVDDERGDDLLVRNWMNGKRSIVKRSEVSQPPAIKPHEQPHGENWLSKPFGTKKEAEAFATQRPGTHVERQIIDGKPGGWHVKFSAPVKSGDKPGHAFRGNQYVNIGETVNTPHGRGIVVAQDYHNVWVSTTKGIKVVPRNQVVKVPQDKSKFPSLLHSAENERRAALNSKLEELNAIEDDAVFAEELTKLAGELK